MGCFRFSYKSGSNETKDDWAETVVIFLLGEELIDCRSMEAQYKNSFWLDQNTERVPPSDRSFYRSTPWGSQ